MKILFGSIDNENPNGKRGIHSIVKPMVKAANEEGHECGMVAGLPLYKVESENDLLRGKLQHLYAHRYFQDGFKTNQSLIPTKSRLQKVRALIEYVKCRMTNKSMVLHIDQDLMPDAKSSWLTSFKFVATIPFFYFMHLRGSVRKSAKRLKSIVSSEGVDVVLMGWPTMLRKADIGSARLVHFVHDSMYIDIESEPIDNATPIKFARDFNSTCFESDLILVNSDDTKNKVLAVNPGADVHVLYGVAPKAKPTSATNALAALGLKPGGYHLFVSSMEKRKNVLGIIEAFLNIIDETDKSLVFVGSEGYAFEEVERLYDNLPTSIKERILFTGYVSEEAKNQLYSHACTYLAPSLYEGLGLGPAEAMAYGVPTLISRKGALPEVGGDASLYVEDPHDIEELSAKMLQLETDDELRSQLIKRGADQYKKFSQEEFNNKFKKALSLLN